MSLLFWKEMWILTYQTTLICGVLGSSCWIFHWIATLWNWCDFNILSSRGSRRGVFLLSHMYLAAELSFCSSACQLLVQKPQQASKILFSRVFLASPPDIRFFCLSYIVLRKSTVICFELLLHLVLPLSCSGSEPTDHLGTTASDHERNRPHAAGLAGKFRRSG